MKRKNRILAVLLVLTGIGTMLYWVNYFAAGDVRVVSERWYTAFEDSFPLADSWMAITAVVAGIGLWRGVPWGTRAGLLAGSALIFLAAMDITFNIENGLYALAATSAPMQFEIAINLWTLVLGLITIVASWQYTDL
ncbi:MAG: hypothetical protein WCA81_13785 [Rhizomicrobium sp.]